MQGAKLCEAQAGAEAPRRHTQLSWALSFTAAGEPTAKRSGVSLHAPPGRLLFPCVAAAPVPNLSGMFSPRGRWLMRSRSRGKCVQRRAERPRADFCDVAKGSSRQALSGEATSRGWLASAPGCPWLSLAVGIKPDFTSNDSPWDIRTHSTLSAGIRTSEEILDRGTGDVALCRQALLWRYAEPQKP